ncbi:MAG: hypothetical protein A2V62_07010 [Nitrospirae bacterium RBG_19FT_COMBO_58_9]|nr:MAG: hypothetical protein A2V62_07010 [Nitrospirae bacterium RBG_19FT_COMBO_58_9]
MFTSVPEVAAGFQFASGMKLPAASCGELHSVRTDKRILVPASRVDEHPALVTVPSAFTS